jgi:uncharacterized protein (TIGR03905 family)
MKYTYTPRDVCSSRINLTLEEGIVRNAAFEGGCNGNLQGICRLIEGMNAQDAIDKLEGIRCGSRQTSCPDQLANIAGFARSWLCQRVRYARLPLTSPPKSSTKVHSCRRLIDCCATAARFKTYLLKVKKTGSRPFLFFLINP